MSAMFYRELVHTVLLLGAETWVLLVEMSITLEVVARGILQTGDMKEG